MGAGGACRDDRVVRALEAVPDGNVAGGQIDEASRNEERADAARALLLQQERRLGDAVEAADARADEHSRALLLLGRIGLPAGIFQRLLRGRHREDDEVVDLALLLRLHPIVRIELAVG